MLRIAVIDDDEWVRRGRVQALADLGDIEPVISLAHPDALALPDDAWAGLHAVLIDAYLDDADFDHFAGVAVVERVRAACAAQGVAAPMLVVITGHVLNDVLRLRLAEAGADYLFGHAHVRTVDQLAAVVRAPAAVAEELTVDAERLADLGLGPTSHPNEALRWVQAEGMADVFRDAETGESQKTFAVGRRQIGRARDRITEIGGVRRTAKGQRTRVPEWQQVVDLVAALRGKPRPPSQGR